MSLRKADSLYTFLEHVCAQVFHTSNREHLTLKGECVQGVMQADFHHMPTLGNNARVGGLFIARLLTRFEFVCLFVLISRFSLDLFFFFLEHIRTQTGLRRVVPWRKHILGQFTICHPLQHHKIADQSFVGLQDITQTHCARHMPILIPVFPNPKFSFTNKQGASALFFFFPCV